MSLPHRIRPAAEDEISSEVGYYEERRPGLGWRFFDAVHEAIAGATEAPGSCSPLRSPKGMTLRYVPLHGFPFKVVFLHEPDEVVVIAVAHDKRRPNYWRERV